MPKGKFDRRCKNCSQPGHFAKTCKAAVLPHTTEGARLGSNNLPSYEGPLKPSGVVSDNGNTTVSKTVDEGSNPSRPATEDHSEDAVKYTEASVADKINKSLESVPSIVNNYTQAVLATINKDKYPNLYAASERGIKLKEKELDGWNRVAELRREGKILQRISWLLSCWA